LKLSILVFEIDKRPHRSTAKSTPHERACISEPRLVHWRVAGRRSTLIGILNRALLFIGYNLLRAMRLAVRRTRSYIEKRLQVGWLTKTAPDKILEDRLRARLIEGDLTLADHLEKFL
jgi:hypothetical protein